LECGDRSPHSKGSAFESDFVLEAT
jgi:hypothetical protein